MSVHNLPAMIKLLKIDGGVPHYYLQLRTREGDRPPRKGKCTIRLQQLDLDVGELNKPHRSPPGLWPEKGLRKVDA
jgi:hypothetical protein